MSSTLERFRERKNKPMELFVKFPLGEPVIEFTVKRIPQAIMNNALIDVEGTIKRQGIARPSAELEDNDPEKSAFNTEFYLWLAYHIVEQGREHFVGWKSLDGSALPTFNKTSFAEFLSILQIGEKKQLGIAYLQAVSDADTVTEKKEPTGENS